MNMLDYEHLTLTISQIERLTHTIFRFYDDYTDACYLCCDGHLCPNSIDRKTELIETTKILKFFISNVMEKITQQDLLKDDIDTMLLLKNKCKNHNELIDFKLNQINKRDDNDDNENHNQNQKA